MRQSKTHRHYDDSYKGGKHLQHKNHSKGSLLAKKSIKLHEKHTKDKLSD